MFIPRATHVLVALQGNTLVYKIEPGFTEQQFIQVLPTFGPRTEVAARSCPAFGVTAVDFMPTTSPLSPSLVAHRLHRLEADLGASNEHGA